MRTERLIRLKVRRERNIPDLHRVKKKIFKSEVLLRFIFLHYYIFQINICTIGVFNRVVLMKRPFSAP